MHHSQPKPFFLRRFDTDSGLWESMKLDSLVSPPSVEAMNAILLNDGILAYIGRKCKFGILESKLSEQREADSTRSWTSLPRHSLLSTLGLLENTSAAEGRKLVLYGSPRTRALTQLFALIRDGVTLEELNHLFYDNDHHLFIFNFDDVDDVHPFCGKHSFSLHECTEALMDLEEVLLPKDRATAPSYGLKWSFGELVSSRKRSKTS